MTQHPNTEIERSRNMCSIVQRLLSSDQLKSEVTKLCQADREIYALAAELSLELRFDLNVPVDVNRRTTGARIELVEFPDQLRVEYQALWSNVPRETVNTPPHTALQLSSELHIASRPPLIYCYVSPLYLPPPHSSSNSVDASSNADSRLAVRITPLPQIKLDRVEEIRLKELVMADSDCVCLIETAQLLVSMRTWLEHKTQSVYQESDGDHYTLPIGWRWLRPLNALQRSGELGLFSPTCYLSLTERARLTAQIHIRHTIRVTRQQGIYYRGPNAQWIRLKELSASQWSKVMEEQVEEYDVGRSTYQSVTDHQTISRAHQASGYQATSLIASDVARPSKQSEDLTQRDTSKSDQPKGSLPNRALQHTAGEPFIVDYSQVFSEFESEASMTEVSQLDESQDTQRGLQAPGALDGEVDQEPSREHATPEESPHVELNRGSRVMESRVVSHEVAIDDAVSDDAVSDDAVSDGAVSDDAVSDDAVSDDAVSDDAVSDDAVSDDAVSDDAVSDDAVADDAVSDDAVADDAVADDATHMPRRRVDPHMMNSGRHTSAYSIIQDQQPNTHSASKHVSRESIERDLKQLSELVELDQVDREFNHATAHIDLDQSEIIDISLSDIESVSAEEKLNSLSGGEAFNREPLQRSSIEQLTPLQRSEEVMRSAKSSPSTAGSIPSQLDNPLEFEMELLESAPTRVDLNLDQVKVALGEGLDQASSQHMDYMRDELTDTRPIQSPYARDRLVSDGDADKTREQKVETKKFKQRAQTQVRSYDELTSDGIPTRAVPIRESSAREPALLRSAPDNSNSDITRKHQVSAHPAGLPRGVLLESPERPPMLASLSDESTAILDGADMIEVESSTPPDLAAPPQEVLTRVETSAHAQAKTPVHSQAKTPVHSQAKTPVHSQVETPIHSQEQTQTRPHTLSPQAREQLSREETAKLQLKMFSQLRGEKPQESVERPVAQPNTPNHQDQASRLADLPTTNHTPKSRPKSTAPATPTAPTVPTGSSTPAASTTPSSPSSSPVSPPPRPPLRQSAPAKDDRRKHSKRRSFSDVIRSLTIKNQDPKE